MESSNEIHLRALLMRGKLHCVIKISVNGVGRDTDLT